MKQPTGNVAGRLSVLADLPFDPTDASLPRGLRRFGNQLARFGHALQTAQSPVAGSGSLPLTRHPEESALAHRLYLANGRTPLFMLQGLARLERGTRRHRETFDEVLTLAKVLEDGLGEVDFWWGFLDQSETWGLPADVRRWAEIHHAHACGKVEAWLWAHDWVAHRYQPQQGRLRLQLRQLGRALHHEAWPGRRKERRKIAKFLVNRLRRLHTVALALDMDDLEGGLHELRRKLRWISIYAAALEGALVLDEEAAPPPGWDCYLTETVVGSKFAKLPAADPETDPLAIPAPLFYALSWLIADLGAIKDRAAWSMTLDAGLRATKHQGEPGRWLGEQDTDHLTAGGHARQVVGQALVRDAVLLRLADALEVQV